jgi:hypothetical protein
LTNAGQSLLISRQKFNPGKIKNPAIVRLLPILFITNPLQIDPKTETRLSPINSLLLLILIVALPPKADLFIVRPETLSTEFIEVAKGTELINVNETSLTVSQRLIVYK